MVPYKDKCLKIVQEYPSTRTGETVYKAEDGSLWSNASYKTSSDLSSGEKIKFKRGDRICDY